MNYSKNLNRRQIANRIVLSWAIVSLVAGVLGGVMGYGVHAHMTHKNSQKENQATVEGSTEEKPTEGKYEGLAIQYKIDTLFKLAKVTDDAEKKAEYLGQIEQILKEEVE